jgi:tripartite-type tricarboxylate transporter receptor subunit TctC
MEDVMGRQKHTGRLAVMCASWGLCALVAGGTWAQEGPFPSGPVRILTTYAPGSQSDLSARTIADHLHKPLGVSVIVDNRGGAGGLIATWEALKSRPLGYTMLYSTTSLTGNLYGFKNPGYKLEDFAVVGVAGYTHYGLIINTKLPVKSVPQLIAYLKENPGKVNFGSVGPSAGSTVLGERFKYLTRTDMVNVPFKGGQPLSVALLGGFIQVYWATLNTARTRMKQPNIIGLAVTAPERRKELPDLPTFKELGLPQMELSSWSAVFLPSAAPKPALDRLRAGFEQAKNASDLPQQWAKQAVLPWTQTLDEFMAYIKKEGEEVGEDFKRMGIEPIDNKI